MDSSSPDDDQLSLLAVITDNFGEKLTLDDSPPPDPRFDEQHDVSIEIDDDHDNDDDGDDEDDDEDEEFEFSFAGEEIGSPVSAEELFCDGKIRPLFPYTDENAFCDGESSYGPSVKKLFVVQDDDVAEGPYLACSSDKSSTELSKPEMSKKSNSTGFSKLWKVKDLLVRSNSDGRDSFVLFPGKESAVVKEERKKKVSLRKLKIGGNTTATAAAARGGSEEKKVTKKKGKKQAAAANTTAYESLYMNKEKKKAGKSYLPYRQDLVGFFTNANGMTRNVHPY